MKKALIILLLVFIIGCKAGGTIEHEDITLKTEDNFEIKADYFNADSEKSLILIHQLSMTKHSWNSFAQKAKDKGYNVISIDLRGHGLSQGNWEEFDDEDFNNMVFDVKAAYNYLKEKHPNTKIAVIGASIGANLSIKSLANLDISTSVALSPGLDYKGIETSDDIKKVDKNVLIIVGKGDKYSYDSSEELAGKNSKVELKAYERQEHGTNLLNEEVESLIFDWLGSNI